MAVRRFQNGPVATVLLDRPEKANALDVAHLTELRQHLASTSADPSVRVIILTGAGDRAFCAGADQAGAHQLSASVAEAFALDLDEAGIQGLYVRLLNLSTLNLRKPVIAAVNGFCLGGGLEIALQCDLIVASETASFGLPEVVLATLPGAGGVSNLLRAIPRAIAMRMLLTGERISASQALQIGLVSDIYPAERLSLEAEALALRIAQNGPFAIQLVKMLADHSTGLASSQSFQMTELAWSLLRETEDRAEGKAAFTEKRKPVYRGR